MTAASAKGVLISDNSYDEDIIQITMTRQGSVIVEIDVSALFVAEDIEVVFAFINDR